eukprot:6190421-Pleurochrysis_carterae.AAC.2
MMIALPASKADPFDVVWGGTPTYVPFAPHAPIRAFEAVAAIFRHDDAPPTHPLITADDGRPWTADFADTLLARLLLLRFLPAPRPRRPLHLALLQNFPGVRAARAGRHHRTTPGPLQLANRRRPQDLCPSTRALTPTLSARPCKRARPPCSPTTSSKGSQRSMPPTRPPPSKGSPPRSRLTPTLPPCRTPQATTTQRHSRRQRPGHPRNPRPKASGSAFTRRTSDAGVRRPRVARDTH